jgi:hypothetical protein
MLPECLQVAYKNNIEGMNWDKIFQYSLLRTFTSWLMIQILDEKPSCPCTTHILLATSLLASDTTPFTLHISEFVFLLNEAESFLKS